MTPPEKGTFDPDGNSRQDRTYESPSGQRPPSRRRDRAREKTVISFAQKPAQDVFVSNLKILAIFLAGLIVLLVIAYMFSSRSWDSKRARVTRTQTTELSSTAQDRAKTRRHTKQLVFPGDDQTPSAEVLREATMLARRGESLEEAGDLAGAAETFQEALEAWPNLAQVRSRLGRLYLRLNEYAKAQTVLDIAVEQNPASASLINDLGVAHFRQQRTDAAARQFAAALQLDPEYPEALFNMALCQLARSDHAGATEFLDHYLILRPGDPRASKERAFVDAVEGNYSNALERLRQAIAIDPAWPPLYYDAAATEALMGNGEDAIKHLEKAEELTSPAAVYLMYQQPAFDQVRRTENGIAFEKALLERARTQKNVDTVSARAVLKATEPMISGWVP